MKAREKRSKWVTTLLLLFCLIIFLLPFYFILVNAFKPMSEIAENVRSKETIKTELSRLAPESDLEE